jgi:hypothetical protein
MLWQLMLRAASLAIATTALTACTMVDGAIGVTENGAYRLLGVDTATPPPPVPDLDLQTLSWQKFAPARRDLDAAQIAIIDNDTKIGATRVALRVEPGQSLPAFWQEAKQTYTVVKGTFVVEGVDAKGMPQSMDQGPGTFVRVPALMIQHLRTKPDSEAAVMLVTVYGDWKVNFLDDTASVAETQRTAN